MRKGGRRCGPTFSSWGFGGAVSPPTGSGAEPRSQTHFGNNLLKIGWKSGLWIADYTPNSDPRCWRQYSHVGLPHIDCLLHDHMVNYEKAAIPCVMGYDIIWMVRVLIILYCSWGRAHATCLGIEATISVEKNYEAENAWNNLGQSSWTLGPTHAIV